ncbi:uncharacterized protein LOC131143968 [Malania oleifera]|uniref:uncharacterized protein LOC131143968 n=1 Tax=Malania oleifera TaxID=397392 RepID=UPI0025ADB8D8|nr:uncharacterized protein LOC131143968 [Malania oleifera]
MGLHYTTSNDIVLNNHQPSRRISTPSLRALVTTYSRSRGGNEHCSSTRQGPEGKHAFTLARVVPGAHASLKMPRQDDIRRGHRANRARRAKAPAQEEQTGQAQSKEEPRAEQWALGKKNKHRRRGLQGRRDEGDKLGQAKRQRRFTEQLKSNRNAKKRGRREAPDPDGRRGRGKTQSRPAGGPGGPERKKAGKLAGAQRKEVGRAPKEDPENRPMLPDTQRNRETRGSTRNEGRDMGANEGRRGAGGQTPRDNPGRRTEARKWPKTTATAEGARRCEQAKADEGKNKEHPEEPRSREGGGPRRRPRKSCMRETGRRKSPERRRGGGAEKRWGRKSQKLKREGKRPEVERDPDRDADAVPETKAAPEKGNGKRKGRPTDRPVPSRQDPGTKIGARGRENKE